MSNNNNSFDSGSKGNASNANDSASNKIKMVIDKPNQFPWKLYDMLDIAEKRGEEHIISWIRNGTAFKVHNRDVFIEEYMKKQFNQTKFKSFQRQLNLWGFERIQTGPDKGSYFHPLFIKGQKDCCQRLSRVRLKGAPSSSSSAKHTATASITRGGDALDQDRKLPASLAGGGGNFAVAVGGGTVGNGGAFPTSEVVPSVAAPIHGFTSPEPLGMSGIEATLRGTSQQQIADLLRYQQEGQHRETLAAVAAGLRPDVASLLAPNAPLSATTDRSTLVVNGLLQHQRELALRQQVQEEEEKKQQGEPEPYQQMQNQTQHQGGKMLPTTDSQPVPSTLPENGQNRSSSQPSRSDEMAALLAVSAQRRREEELALLLELSKPKGVDV